MEPTHTQCRVFGHSWRPSHVERVGRRRQYSAVLVCGRCETLRKMLISFDGERLRNTYSYPDGYLVPNPPPNLRTVLLLEMFADLAQIRAAG